MVNFFIISCFLLLICSNASSFGFLPYLAIVLYLFPSMIESKNSGLFFVSSLMVNFFSSLAILASSCVLFSMITLYSIFLVFIGFALMFNNSLPYFSAYS